MTVPIKFKSGTSIGPVALICATIAFLSLLGVVLLLVLYADTTRVEWFVKPFAPVLSVIGAAAVLWLKMHLDLKATTEQNETIAAKADDAKRTVDTRLNGELDGRIRAAVTDVLNAAQNSATTTPTPGSTETQKVI